MIARKNRGECGFTLIELMVSATIVLLLSGVSLAAFLSYRDDRKAQDDAAMVADRLRTVQIKATAVEVPTGCTSVKNYIATMAAGSQSLTVSATCSSGNTVDLPPLALTLKDSTFQSGSTVVVIFDSRTVSASPGSVKVCWGAKVYKVEVSASASVSRPLSVGGSCD